MFAMLLARPSVLAQPHPACGACGFEEARSPQAGIAQIGRAIAERHDLTIEQAPVREPHVGEEAVEAVPVPGDDGGRIEAESNQPTFNEPANVVSYSGTERFVQLGAVDAHQADPLASLKLEGVAVYGDRDPLAVRQVGRPQLPVVGESLAHAACVSM